jgi:hypothetical protein
MSSFKRQKDPLPPKEIPFDPEVTEEFIIRLINLKREEQITRTSIRELKEDFKGAVDIKLVTHSISIVRKEEKLTATDETRSSIKDLVKNHIGKLAT